MTELPKLIAEFAVAPIRAQEDLDAAWLLELARAAFLQPTPSGGDLLAELAAMLAPRRPILQKYEIDVTVQFQFDRTGTFRLMAETLNGAWQSLFGADAESPKLGLEYRRETKTSQKTGIYLEVVQAPLSSGTPARSPAGGTG